MPCTLQPPHRTLLPTSTPSRPSSTPSWSLANLTALRLQNHSRLFSPLNPSIDGYASAIHASQFPLRCDDARMLIVEDDLRGQGLGYSREWYVLVLLWAMHERRVLREVPVDPAWNPTCVPAADIRRSQHEGAMGLDTLQSACPHKTPSTCSYPCVSANLTRTYSRNFKLSPSTSNRWCDRPPYTLQCLFEPWTHCPVPPESEHTPPHLGRGLDVRQNSKLNANTKTLRVKLSWVYRSRMDVKGSPFFGLRKNVESAASRFLFRPRKWIRKIANCVLNEAGVSKGGYFSVHVRHSVEKNTELLKFMHSTLPLEVYAAASVEAGKALGLYTVHLQTASEDALHAFVAAASRSEPPLRVFYTNNSREVGSRPRDTWGGWVTGREMSEGTVAAVNAYLAMQAPLLISSVHSSWTKLLKDLMQARSTMLCCGCTKLDYGGNLEVISNNETLLNQISNGSASSKKWCGRGGRKDWLKRSKEERWSGVRWDR